MSEHVLSREDDSRSPDSPGLPSVAAPAEAAIQGQAMVPLDAEGARREVRLWAECRAGDEAAREQLVLRYLAFAKRLAVAKQHRFPRTALDELVAAASRALIDAVDKFDLTRGSPFTAYARVVISRALQAEVGEEALPDVARAERAQIWHVRRTHDRLMRRGGPAPRIADIAAAAHLTPQQVDVALTVLAARTDSELAARLAAATDDRTAADDHERAEERAGITRAAHRLLATLSKRERHLLVLTYWGDASSTEIAQRLGLTENNVRQIRLRALTKLRSAAEAISVPSALHLCRRPPSGVSGTSSQPCPPVASPHAATGRFAISDGDSEHER